MFCALQYKNNNNTQIIDIQFSIIYVDGCYEKQTNCHASLLWKINKLIERGCHGNIFWA